MDWNLHQHQGVHILLIVFGHTDRYFFRGLVGGVLTVLFIHAINALLGYAQLSLPSELPYSSQDVLAFFKAYGSVLFLAFRGALLRLALPLSKSCCSRHGLLMK